MIKTILVPTSGRDSDLAVFETALAVACTTQAHLEFYHVRVSPGKADTRRALDFCSAHGVPVGGPPRSVAEVSASFFEESDHAVDRLLQHARHRDLIVWGRRQHEDYMPAPVIEDLLMYSGRPILLAARQPAQRINQTIVVAWNETSQSAHALSAALPLLMGAHRVVLVSVAKTADRASFALAQLSSQLAWHRISTESCVIDDKPSRTSLRLQQKALELKAQLLVLGAFERGPAREHLFGGVTCNFLEKGGCPVLVAH